MSRSGHSHQGNGVQFDTFDAHSGIVSAVASGGAASVKGKAVTITGNDEYGYGSAGDPLRGVILHYEDEDCMTVQYRGYAELDGVSGALPTAGNYLVVDGAGAVSATATATNAYAVSVGSDSATGPVIVLIS
ncbi:MAG: hypothetical protein HPY66_1654 [Firmicutes bacterium]|nr:hypothetical protein [Bacillota bacterium]